MKKTVKLLLSILMSLVLLTSATALALEQTIVDIAAGNPDFSILVAALQKAELVEALQGEGPLTVFAPTDAAFQKLLEELNITAEELLNHPQLTDVLLYHVVAGKVMSTDLQNGMEAETLGGLPVLVDLTSGVLINGSAVTAADIEASNGVIHVIDTVLIPETFQLVPAEAVEAAAVEAPAQETAQVEEPAAEIAPLPATPATVVDIALGNEDFSILVAALAKAELVETLQGEGPFTVFAPTNAAFKKLFNDLKVLPLDIINHPALADVLLYHVVAGQVLSTDLADGMAATTVGGSDIIIDLKDGVKINSAAVTAADLVAGNGVVHVIDSVLVPETFQLLPAQAAQTAEPAAVVEEPVAEISPLPATIVDIALENKDFSILVAALQKADLVSALQAEGPFTVFAPTDKAIRKLLNELRIMPLELLNHPQLTDVLLNHVVAGKVLSTDLQDGMEATTLGGLTLTVDLKDGVKINGSSVIAADLLAGNGVVHVIDTVLVPETFQLVPAVAVQETEPLAEPVAEEIVEPVVEATVEPTAEPIVEATVEPIAEPAAQLQSIVEIAAGNPDFSILVTALQSAGLVETLQGEGPFTVFAPTNEAFMKLLGQLKVSPVDLLGHPQVADVLLYHVVAGKVMSADLQNGMTAATINGEDLTVDLTNGVKINESNVIAADLEASNGVIHVIDAVLVPASFQLVPETAAQEAVPAEEIAEVPAEEVAVLPATVVDIAAGNADFSILVTALTNAKLVETLKGEGPFTVFAPTNTAFMQLLAQLKVSPMDLLSHPQVAEVLLYHVVAGKVLSTDLQNGMEAETLGGEKITVDLTNGVKINGVNVIAADLKAGNGVVHVIDAVLVPASFQLQPEAAQVTEPAQEPEDEMTAYAELKIGDRGEDILKIKQRFVELGYYRATSTLHDRYTDLTASTVMKFEKNANLPADGIADSEMQTLLYSNDAPRNQKH